MGNYAARKVYYAANCAILLKADLTLFQGLKGGNQYFFLQLEQKKQKQKKTIKASRLNQLLPQFNYLNLKWLI